MTLIDFLIIVIALEIIIIISLVVHMIFLKAQIANLESKCRVYELEYDRGD